MINVRKERGMTSADVVYKLRRLLGEKKIGHTGTLDPDAEGVLPICVGKATRLAEYYLHSGKTYRVEATLGVTTDTQDATGHILVEREVAVTEAAVQETLFSFLGESEQIPPMYSALKVGGQKLCDLARRGESVPRASRTLVISELCWLGWEDGKRPRATFVLSCGKGAYMRTLCHDLGEKLGTGAHMSALCRLEAGGFKWEDSRTFAEIEALHQAGKRDFLLPMGYNLELPVVTLPPERRRAFRDGLPTGLVDGTPRAASPTDGTPRAAFPMDGVDGMPWAAFPTDEVGGMPQAVSPVDGVDGMPRAAPPTDGVIVQVQAGGRFLGIGRLVSRTPGSDDYELRTVKVMEVEELL
jgi:tRNA pseudouridine55 synthase